MSVADMCGVGVSSRDKLLFNGIKNIGDLASSDRSFIESFLGRSGGDLWIKARGCDESKVEPSSSQKSIGNMQTYYDNTRDIYLLEERLSYLIEKVSYRMRVVGGFAKCISVFVRYDDFSSGRSSHSLEAATDCEDELKRCSSGVFRGVLDPLKSVRALGVTFEIAEFGDKQLSIFDSSRKSDEITQCLDEIRAEYGFDSVMTARAMFGKKNACND
jgi:DNA polymerase-4